MMRLKLSEKGLQVVELLYQLADKYNFRKQVSNMQDEIYLMYLNVFSNFYSLLTFGILVNLQVQPMIIVDNTIYSIIKLLVITNVNSILMI